MGGIRGPKHVLWISAQFSRIERFEKRADAIADEVHFDAILIYCGSTEPGVNQLVKRVSFVSTVGEGTAFFGFSYQPDVDSPCLLPARGSVVSTHNKP
ncbi:hypothetical protein O9992_22070 [Vibrio lentus]|nr:hypothetical protein [Vibrio lentus]